MLSLQSDIFLAFPHSNSKFDYRKLVDDIIGLDQIKDGIDDFSNIFLKNDMRYKMENCLKERIPDFDFGDYSDEKINDSIDLFYKTQIENLENEIREAGKLLSSKSILKLVDIYLKLWKSGFNIEELKGTEKTDIDYLTSLLILRNLIKYLQKAFCML